VAHVKCKTRWRHWYANHRVSGLVQRNVCVTVSSVIPHLPDNVGSKIGAGA
jgi:hypothetical protein